MIYAIIEKGTVTNIIEIDETIYDTEDVQKIFGTDDNLLLPLPDLYGIGDLYDVERQKWTKVYSE